MATMADLCTPVAEGDTTMGSLGSEGDPDETVLSAVGGTSGGVSGTSGADGATHDNQVFPQGYPGFGAEVLPPERTYGSRDEAYKDINAFAAAHGYAFSTSRSFQTSSGLTTVLYACDRGGRAGDPNRVMKRQRALSRRIGCNFSVYVKERRDKSWQLKHRLGSQFAQHNHAPSADIYAHRVHRALDADQKDSIDVLLQMDMKLKQIVQFLRLKYRKQVHARDVSNYIASARRQRGNPVKTESDVGDGDDGDVVTPADAQDVSGLIDPALSTGPGPVTPRMPPASTGTNLLPPLGTPGQQSLPPTPMHETRGGRLAKRHGPGQVGPQVGQAGPVSPHQHHHQHQQQHQFSQHAHPQQYAYTQHPQHQHQHPHHPHHQHHHDRHDQHDRHNTQNQHAQNVQTDAPARPTTEQEDDLVLEAELRAQLGKELSQSTGHDYFAQG